MPSLPPVWRRRVVAMAVLAVLVAVPAALLIRSGDGDEPASERSEPVAEVRDRGLGLRVMVPDGWRRSKRQGVLRLRSRDRAVGMTVSAPGPARDAGAIFATAREVIRDQHRRVATRRRFRARLDGRPARVAVLTAIDAEHRTPLLIDAIAVEGRRRAYLVEVFTDARAGPGARAAAQSVLRLMRFTK